MMRNCRLKRPGLVRTCGNPAPKASMEPTPNKVPGHVVGGAGTEDDEEENGDEGNVSPVLFVSDGRLGPVKFEDERFERELDIADESGQGDD